MSRLEWRSAMRYSVEVWNLRSTGDNVTWDSMNGSIVGTITYVGWNRRADWADRKQRWRITRMGGGDLGEIEVKDLEEAKATALAILQLTN
ncbi:MAG: hypothetical protein RJA99_3213 [Pseudomonadota bacterium]|jgi:hypothetical protein